MKALGLLLALLLLAACAPTPAAGPSVACQDVRAARQAVSDLQGIFQQAQAHVSSRAQLQADAGRAQAVLDGWGARAVGDAELRTAVGGALAAGEQVLHALSRGESGTAEAALYGALLKAATTETNRARAARGCP